METARLEDDVISMLSNITDGFALHGGTAVWRCYGGKRFSTDIDAYVWDENFKTKFTNAAKGIGIEATKFGGRGVTFIHVIKNETEIKVEPRNVEKAAILVPYERVDGSKTNVLALSPEDMILEKIAAYNDRRAYKDLYDITILLNKVKETDKMRDALSEFAKDIPPPDENVQSYSEFKAVIYTGVIPSYQKMSEFIRRWSS